MYDIIVNCAYDLIFLSLESWDHIWRRNQFICNEYARRHPRGKILFVTPPRDVSNAVRRWDWGQLRHGAVWSPEGLPNVRVFRPDKWLPNTLEPCRRLNIRHLRRQLFEVMRREGVTQPILWINDHALHELAGTLGEAAIIYDITDDWTSFGQSDRLRRRIERQDADLCRRADAVIVCSQRLYEMKRGLTDRLHLIPNGVDASHYAAVLNETGPLPEAAARWPKPVFGYTGSLHGDRVDIELVREVARRLDGSIVFVGPDMLMAEQRRRMTEPGNVIIHGPVAYQELPQYMRAFDVCIVPHRMTAFTESLNPIKLWEYLAAGKPIVATDIAGFRDYPQFVRLAHNAEEFTGELQGALSEDPRICEQRRQEARKHSWASRVDQIEQVLEEAQAQKRA